MLALYAIAWFALTQTAWGRHVYAVGDNPEAARRTGINTNRVLLSVYTLAGLMSGIAALLLVARTELGDPNAGQTTENLDSITAVVHRRHEPVRRARKHHRDAHRRRDRRACSATG